MPFTAHDLRYHYAETYPLLYAHLKRQAQHYLGSLKHDAFEQDVVIGHVMEQLVRSGLAGAEDKTPLTALDRFTPAQFYTFINHCVRNKAIDRLRKRRLPVSSASELESPDMEGEDNPLNDAVESVWGTVPFATPEEAALEAASQQSLRNVLKHCLKELSAAPRQLQAVLQEADEFGAMNLLHDVIKELHDDSLMPDLAAPIAHASQNKDHAHKKLRHCLQQQSSHLTVRVALRLTEYGVRALHIEQFSIDIATLAQDDLSQDEVRLALRELTREGKLDWHGEEIVIFSPDQLQHLLHFYKED